MSQKMEKKREEPRKRTRSIEECFLEEAERIVAREKFRSVVMWVRLNGDFVVAHESDTEALSIFWRSLPETNCYSRARCFSVDACGVVEHGHPSVLLTDVYERQSDVNAKSMTKDEKAKVRVRAATAQYFTAASMKSEKLRNTFIDQIERVQ